MNQEVQLRVRRLALEVAGALQDLPENVVINKYELDTSYSSIDNESFRLILNGTTFYVAVTKEKKVVCQS